ncbi:hypothetical protein [Vulcanisaeta sp. JCM 14467]|uniref:hypothetical protein n=1 Tax=Vulcanisaeta sp. JCM 14467 TaxID=1295370 RepID=UPI0006D0CCD8|nr:hypothetical protein [Vulcanisaeta sp. JCM 14467]
MSMISFFKEVRVREFVKPTMTYDKRPMIIMSVEVDGQVKRLNLVGEQGTTVQQFIEWLVRKKLIVRDNEGYTIYVPTAALAKERDGTIWVHARDYKPLVGD